METFRRVEIKYMLSSDQCQALLELIQPNIVRDRYFASTNCSIYFDTDNKDLVIHSMEKPLYKEKLRLRSYNVPTMDDTVFIEIKRKFSGVGAKRRIAVKLKDFYQYLETGELTSTSPQIKSEIDYCINFYHLKPKLFLAYDRNSYCGKADNAFRLTFDRNIRSRETDLRLENGDAGAPFFDDDTIIMETKTLDAYPLWFSQALAQLKIYPASFSKYGKVYQKIMVDKSTLGHHYTHDTSLQSHHIYHLNKEYHYV